MPNIALHSPWCIAQVRSEHHPRLEIAAHRWHRSITEARFGGLAVISPWDTSLGLAIEYTVPTPGTVRFHAVRSGIETNDDEIVAAATWDEHSGDLAVTHAEESPRARVALALIEAACGPVVDLPAGWKHWQHHEFTAVVDARLKDDYDDGIHVIDVFTDHSPLRGQIRISQAGVEWFPLGIGLRALPQQPTNQVGDLITRIAADLSTGASHI